MRRAIQLGSVGLIGGIRESGGTTWRSLAAVGEKDKFIQLLMTAGAIFNFIMHAQCPRCLLGASTQQNFCNFSDRCLFGAWTLCHIDIIHIGKSLIVVRPKYQIYDVLSHSNPTYT